MKVAKPADITGMATAPGAPAWLPASQGGERTRWRPASWWLTMAAGLNRIEKDAALPAG